jgi:hypothetical protein
LPALTVPLSSRTATETVLCAEPSCRNPLQHRRKQLLPLLFLPQQPRPNPPLPLLLRRPPPLRKPQHPLLHPLRKPQHPFPPLLLRRLPLLLLPRLPLPTQLLLLPVRTAPLSSP